MTAASHGMVGNLLALRWGLHVPRCGGRQHCPQGPGVSGAERAVLSTGARYQSSCDLLSLGLAFVRPALSTPRALSSALTTLRRGKAGGRDPCPQTPLTLWLQVRW